MLCLRSPQHTQTPLPHQHQPVLCLLKVSHCYRPAWENIINHTTMVNTTVREDYQHLVYQQSVKTMQQFCRKINQLGYGVIESPYSSLILIGSYLSNIFYGLTPSLSRSIWNIFLNDLCNNFGFHSAFSALVCQ